MIPVFQTRYATETFGNCFEACVASILELPLSAVPDRAALVDGDAWADLVTRTRAKGGETAVGDLELPDAYDDGEAVLQAWLAERGLAWLDLDIDPKGLTAKAWLGVAARIFDAGYWIGHTRQSRASTAHATVWKGDAVVHNPHRGGPVDAEALGPLFAATVLAAGNPPLLARTLDPLPDVVGRLGELSRPVPIEAVG